MEAQEITVTSPPVRIRTRPVPPAPPPAPVRTRTRPGEAEPTPPLKWPNGSAVYRKNTAHLKTDEGLLGYTLRVGERYQAWRYSAKTKGVSFAGWHAECFAALSALSP